jgi:hypothetical protein
MIDELPFKVVRSNGTRAVNLLIARGGDGRSAWPGRCSLQELPQSISER